jgi:aminopeptidase-like protein
LLLAAVCSAENLKVDLVARPILMERLAAGAVPPGKRQATIHDLFANVGCMAEEQPVFKKASNVICTTQGETASMIVVGGHFDFADRGAGIVDDWSGASLLPSLVESLKSQPRKHTYVFVAFAAEERGLIGSTRYVRQLAPEQKSALRAFVNLECLGLTPPKVWAHRATPELLTRLAEIAAALKITVQGVNVEKVGDDDSHPFADARLPVITIHSITQDTFKILHSVNDQVKAINPDDYYEAYRLIAFYLAYLDKVPQ